MIRAEIRKYLTTPLYWILVGVSGGLLLVQSVIMFAAHQVGLLNLTAYDYLLSSMNFYLTYLLPFLYPLFAAYTYVSELQWRTLMYPFFDGISRRSWLGAKGLLIGLSLLGFAGLYLLLALGIAGVGFSFKDIYLESHRLSPVEAFARIAGGTFWISFVLYPFGLIALLLSILSRSVLVGGLGGGFAFYAVLLFQRSPSNPWHLLFTVAQHLAQMGEFPGSFRTLVVQSVTFNLGVIGLVLVSALLLFERKDIVLG